jgi:DNA polymerase-3 subunit alpha
MAALMTSVIDNSTKVSEYIFACRQMGIQILPPDINAGESAFSVSGQSIRYGLSAIKSIGRPVIDAIVRERNDHGPFTTLQDFIERLSGKEVNKRTIESFIKAGALDSLQGTRKQLMMIYVQILDQVNANKKNTMSGQMSLFDIVGEEDKKDFEVKFPDVGEYSKEVMLSFEKEVLGVYITGHPLEEYESIWKKNISAVTSDFLLNDDTGESKVMDGVKETIGGMITQKTIKYTRTNQTMAFLTLEDLLGTVEVIVFPRDYEKNSNLLVEDSKVFVQGRVVCEEDKPSKLICEKIIPFEVFQRNFGFNLRRRKSF